MVVRLTMRLALVPFSIFLAGFSGGTSGTVYVSAASRSVVSTAACMWPCLETWTSNQ